MSAYANLRLRRRLFVDAYVRLGVGSEAAREAGYSQKNPDVIASKILADPEVKAAIAEKLEQYTRRVGVRPERVLEELARIAFMDPGQLTDENGEFLPLRQIPVGARAAISGLRVAERFEEGKRIGRKHDYRTHSKVEALRVLHEYLNPPVHRHEHTGKDGGPIETKELSDLEKARRIAFLLTGGLRASTPLSDGPLEPDSGRAAGDSPPST